MALSYTENNKMHTKENLPEADRRIRDIIDGCEDGDYSEALKADESGIAFYHLSDVRIGALAWYDFKPEASVLQIGAEFGALTGFLCEKCRQVTILEESSFYAESIHQRWKGYKNLTIYVGDVTEWKTEESFDYIILDHFAGKSEEWGRTLVKRLLSMLNPCGKLLMLADNRLGIKYFCGAPEPNSGLPFVGVNGYQKETAKRLFSKAELENIIVKAGVKNYRFFYLMPDRVFTQAVYTDEYLPQNSIRDRVIPYYPEKSSLILAEDSLYDDMIQNRMLPQLSNSFLIECSMNGGLSDAVFAALSVDRGKEHGFATVVYENDVVRKRAVFASAQKSLETLCSNLSELRRNGISVVPHEKENDSVKMPRIRSKNLVSMLDDLIRSDAEAFVEVFEELYRLILSSSEAAEFASNELDCGGADEETVGLILKHACIDMIPYNCFCLDGEYVFYDQEFMRDNYPAKYILFRALRHTFFYIKDAEKFLTLEEMKKKFGLTELWPFFEIEEARFVENNRNYDLYSQFYRWAGIDKNILLRNAQKLLHKDEPVCESKAGAVPVREREEENEDKLAGRKRVGLKLLQEFDRVCRENGLGYCVIYGTLLGAVRHKGFIPWDDDIDVAMPRADFDNLRRLAPDKWGDNYFLQTPENDPECFYGGYYKLRDSSTAGMEARNRKHNCNQGLWMDIFPLDYCFTDSRLFKYHLKAIRLIQEMLFEQVYPEERREYCRIVKLFAGLVPHKQLCRFLNRTISACSGNGAEKVGILAQYSEEENCFLIEKDALRYVVWADFENMKVPVPLDYESCLKVRNGADYMMYPEAKDRKTHHHILADDKKSYRVYQNVDSEKIFARMKEEL